MRIKTQDDSWINYDMVKRLVAVEGLVIAYFDTQYGYNSTELGNYESHERALQVIDAINEFYAANAKIYTMPKK